MQARSPLAAAGHPVASLRLLLEVPSIESMWRRQLPVVRSEELPAFGPLVPTSVSRSVLVVSHHLDGLLRHPHCRRCCNLLSIVGFTALLDLPRLFGVSRKSPVSTLPAFPAVHSPLEESPRPQSFSARRSSLERLLCLAESLPPCRSPPLAR
jgi:hypothetical protein